MRSRLALVILIGTAAAALADSAPVLVIPGRLGVPIIINGVDASYAVVEGDWGLAQRVHVTPTVYGGRYVDPVPNVGHYYPSAGHRPGYGRLEIEPPANRRQRSRPTATMNQSHRPSAGSPRSAAICSALLCKCGLMWTTPSGPASGSAPRLPDDRTRGRAASHGPPAAPILRESPQRRGRYRRRRAGCRRVAAAHRR